MQKPISNLLNSILRFLQYIPFPHHFIAPSFTLLCLGKSFLVAELDWISEVCSAKALQYFESWFIKTFCPFWCLGQQYKSHLPEHCSLHREAALGRQWDSYAAFERCPDAVMVWLAFLLLFLSDCASPESFKRSSMWLLCFWPFFPPTDTNTYEDVKMFHFRWVLSSCHLNRRTAFISPEVAASTFQTSSEAGARSSVRSGRN